MKPRKLELLMMSILEEQRHVTLSDCFKIKALVYINIAIIVNSFDIFDWSQDC